MKTAFVVPTYNEAENLPALALRVFGQTDADLLCVDDDSPDGTGAIADGLADANPRFHVIHRTTERGYARACREGLAWCLEQGYDLVGTIDADLSHDPSVVPALVAEVLSGADLAIGSRYVPGGKLVVDWGPFRRAVSRAGSAYARRMIGTGVRDCTSGFRCYRASSLAGIPFRDLTSDGYCFLIETLGLLVDSGASVKEVPITYIERQAGQSKISNKVIFEAFARTTALGFSRLAGTPRAAGGP